MKIVKPMAVSFGFRTFQIVGKKELSVTTLVGFALGIGVRRLVSEIALWPAIGEVTGGSVDEGLPKPRGEVLVFGSCHTPGQLPLPAAMVRVRVAPPGSGSGGQEAFVDKQLAVFGDRYWIGTASRDPGGELPGSTKTTDPVPFTEMPLTWERAFGGPSHPKNPRGRGTERIDAGDGSYRLPVPNVELPANLVTRSAQRPDPAGFGPIDVSRPQRQLLAGTYGGRWLEEDFPGYARDTDPTFFCCAPPDQRVEGYFRGDEEYVLENMHPTRVTLRGRLPGISARVLLRRTGSNDVEDVRMTLDTIAFLPGKEIGVLVFRGLTPVADDDASDIAVALAACEETDVRRTTEHYRASLDRRLDRDQSPLLALNEDDLVPSFAAGCGMAELLGKLEDPAKARRERIRDRTLARVREQLVQEGVEEPDAVLARATEKSPLMERLERLPDPADPKDLAEFAAALEEFTDLGEQQLAESIRATDKDLEDTERTLNEELHALGPRATPEAKRKQHDAIAKIEQTRRMLAGRPLPDDATPMGDGPPAPQSPEVLALYRDTGVEPDPSLVQKLEQADAAVLDGYRRSAHYLPPARLPAEDARIQARRRVLELHATGKRLDELDLTRVDLSALDLAGTSLRRTLLEGADATGTNLAGADLTGAMLAHSVLRGTRLDGATLEHANLGATRVDRASFAGAALRNAILARSRLTSVSFRGADLTGVDWLEAELGAVDFEDAVLSETTFLYEIESAVPTRASLKKDPAPRDLRQCRFPRAKLAKASFLVSQLEGVDFTGADLELVTFLSVKADGASFRGASMRKLHAVMGCSFAGANFEGADLRGAFLRGADLRGANFERACLEGADLSECDLTGSMLSRAQARSAFFIRADLTGAKVSGAHLMEAMLQKSNLQGADVSGANLFASNLGLVRVDGKTRVDGANLKRALMLPRAPKSS